MFDKDEKKIYTTMLAIPNQRPEPSDKPIILFSERATGSPQAVKVWYYPGETIGNEFVYPKTQAMQNRQGDALARPRHERDTKPANTAGEIPVEMKTRGGRLLRRERQLAERCRQTGRDVESGGGASNARQSAASLDGDHVERHRTTTASTTTSNRRLAGTAGTAAGAQAPAADSRAASHCSSLSAACRSRAALPSVSFRPLQYEL